ncbi:condensation domain-containing protein, partial [Flavitalea flava]
SWAFLIQRHTILRSGFYPSVFAQPVQAVYREAVLPIVEKDYRNLSSAGQETAIRIYAETDRQQGFDYRVAPLMRISLLRLGETRYRMLWTHHHILLDGWSVQVLVEELLTCYEGLVTGKGLPRQESCIDQSANGEDNYGDYIHYLSGVDREKEEAYWRGYLSGVTEGTLLPFITATAARNKGAAVYQENAWHLSAAETNQIVRFSQRHRLTVNTLMQGVWSYLLYRYSGQSDIVYGVTVSGRPEGLAGVEKRVGLYINTLPFHGRIDQEESVLCWLERIQQEQSASRSFQHTGLSDIQRWLGLPGDLFDSLLVFENYPVSKVINSRSWSLDMEDIRVHEQDNYPLGITIMAGEQISIRFRYNALLLAATYITAIRGHFEQVLLQVTGEAGAVL